tara:strand:- start:2244 stop:2630 length:387 start_codon:yes stop_codon:yes gene_type:complete
MTKKIIVYLFLILLVISNSGCIALLAGAAGGAGTASWLGSKLIQEVDASFDKAIKASEKGFKSLDLLITKKTVKSDVAQILGEYSDGRKIWLDIHKVLPKTSRLELRVGMTSDQQAARKILDRILRYL